MTRFLHTASFLLLLAASLFAGTSCKKSETEPTPPAATPTGTVDGTVTPASSILNVTITTRGSSRVELIGKPDATGYFKLGGLIEGDYVVSFDTGNGVTGYAAPAPQVFHITPNANFALGTIIVYPTVSAAVSYPLRGTTSWTSTNLGGSGASYTSTTNNGTLTLYNGVPYRLEIKATGQIGNVEETIELYLPKYTGQALYTLDYSPTGNYATYLRTSGGAVTYSLNTKVSKAAGTVTITAHNLTARTLSGTFGYNAYNSQGYNDATVSNGTFSLSY